MNIKKMFVKTLSIFLALDVIQFTGCHYGSQDSAQSQSSQSSSEPDKLPADLTGLEDNVETIVKTLDGPAVQESESSQSGQSSSSQQSESSQSEQSSSSQQSESSQSGQSSSSQQGSQSSQQSQTNGPSSSSQQDPMYKIASIVENMHYQWNNLMPEAIKKGANNDLVNNFDNSLNNLSITVKDKNNTNIMLAANQLYAYIPDLYSLFQTKSSPQIKRMRYYARGAILNASTANWSQADSDINNLKAVWILYKSGLSKDQQDLVNKLDLSIYELEKVIKERNQSLVSIKGKIELSNTQALEKATENKSGGESGSQ